MKQDPLFDEFLKIFHESSDVHGGTKKKSFKGNYGGGNEYYQLEPDTELENMRERVLGSGLDKLDEQPGSMTVEPDNFKNYESELQDDLEGETIKPFKPPMPSGFNKVGPKYPTVKSKPEKTIKGKELGENKSLKAPRVIDDSLLVDDSESEGKARDSEGQLSFGDNQFNRPGMLTRECPMASGPLSDSKIENTLDEAYWPFSRFGIRKIKQYVNESVISEMWPFGGKSDPSKKIKKIVSDNSVLIAHVMRKMFKVPRNASLSQFIRKNGNQGQALANALMVAQQEYNRPSKQTVEMNGQSFEIPMPAFKGSLSEQEIQVAKGMDENDLGYMIYGLDEHHKYELMIALGNHKIGRKIDIKEAPRENSHGWRGSPIPDPYYGKDDDDGPNVNKKPSGHAAVSTSLSGAMPRDGQQAERIPRRENSHGWRGSPIPDPYYGK